MKSRIPSLYAIATFFLIFVICQAIIKPGLSSVLPEGFWINFVTLPASAVLSWYMTREVLRRRPKPRERAGK